MRQTKSIYEAPMKRVTLRISDELEREMRSDMRRGETVAKWVRTAVRQRMARHPGAPIEAERRRRPGIVPAPPKRVPQRVKGQERKRITVRIHAWQEREIRLRYMRRGETLSTWVRDAIRESVVRSHAAKIVVRRRPENPAAVKEALRVLDSPAPFRCR